jgi:hypothetical protein
MIRTLFALTLVVGTISAAQQSPPPPLPQPPAADMTPPPPPPVVEAPAATPPAATTPAATPAGPKASDRVDAPEGPKRFSRFSAGPGGPLYAFAQGIDGLVLGGMIGAGLGTGGQLGSSGAFVGALTGVALFAGAGIALQYAHPIGVATAGTAALGLGVGALFGFGLSTALIIGNFSTWAAIALVSSQIVGLIPILALWNVDDIAGEDLALMGMTSGYAFVLTALVAMLFSSIGSTALLSAMLMAPAVGMGLGALWAMGPDLAPGRILKLTALPLGVGLLTFFLGLALTGGNAQITAIATLATTLTTFGLTFFLTADEAPPPAQASKKGSWSVQPSISMAPAGWRNEGMAVGPALVGRF